ncbi:MAG TPA: hypothetical protein VFZ34_05265 [Blastocatellia bacterium]|nr:hypothetical protein [Blastocatellia bacterium]
MKSILLVLLLLSICLPSVAQPEASNQPLTLQDVNILLRRSVGRNMTEGDLAARIQRLGLAFAPTPEIIARLRFNGAHPHLINVIKRAGEKFAPASDKVIAIKDDPVIEEVRKIVKDYVDGLPDFICTQEVERFIDTDGSGAWQRMDMLRYELTYNRKKESYKVANTNGLIGPPRPMMAGATSAGEFASALDELFDPKTEAYFTPAGKEKLGTHQALIYDYYVAQNKSKLDVKIGDDPPFIAGYSGSVWIDADTKQILRIEQAIEDPPPQYRTFSGDKIIDYELVKLRGTDVEVLLPVKAEVMMLNRAQRAYSRNVIFFKFYRKFETDIKFVTSDEEEKKEEKKDEKKPIKPPDGESGRVGERGNGR